MKKVIFIGGTSYSGSTLLDMILSNDPKGYSLGEINALMHPYRKHHIIKRNELLSKDTLWKKIIYDGANKLYENLFNIYNDVDFFVDSSKNPYWINKQIKILNKKKLCYKNIIIFKTILEFAHSMEQRDKLDWFNEWINYHKLYFRVINYFKTVPYKSLVNDENLLYKLCNYLACIIHKLDFKGIICQI